MLRRLRDKAGGKLPCTVSTFGFGYDLDSELLHELAVIGSGTYAFIPDAGFVGTVFVNAMANLLVTVATNVRLTLEPCGGASLPSKSISGSHPCKLQGAALQVELTPLLFGQSKDILLRMFMPPE